MLIKNNIFLSKFYLLQKSKYSGFPSPPFVVWVGVDEIMEGLGSSLPGLKALVAMKELHQKG